MIWTDFAILAIIALSACIGFFRGFLREAMGLATWILAFYIAFVFAAAGAEFLRPWIDTHTVRLAVAFCVLFVGVLVAGAIVNTVLGRLISQTGFAGTDRALGIVFGVVRGVGVLVILVLLAGATPVPRDAWWQQSVFIGHLEQGALWARRFLPPDLARAITYPDAPPQTTPDVSKSFPT